MASNAASSMQCSANGTETARALEGSLGCDDLHKEALGTVLSINLVIAPEKDRAVAVLSAWHEQGVQVKG
jgi:hypothetical protein